MKKLQRSALILALLVTLTGGISASAKSSESASRRVISGVITRVDLKSRTIEVRESGSGRIITARVPSGALLTTDSGLKSGQPIERLLPGVVIRDVVVQQ
jgi:hypothetical protein